MTASTALPTPAEHDERLRVALARLCLELVADPSDDLPQIVRGLVYRRWRSGPMTRGGGEELDLLWVLHAAALRTPSEAWGRVISIAEAARAVQKWAETDGCRDECDAPYVNPVTGLACKTCTEWPHGELDEAVTALVHFVQREVSPTALDGMTS